MREPLTCTQARKLLSSILRNPDGVIAWSSHARKEMKEDGIDEAEALSVLRSGRIDEPAELEHGTWRYRFYRERVWVVVSFNGEAATVVVTAWRRKQ